MNRQERDRYDYGRYDGYNNDEHYHGARNLTNEFEQHYRGGRGTDYDSDRYRPERSYHEGSDIEDTYYSQNRTNQNFGNWSGYMGQDRDTGYFGHYNDNLDNYRGNGEIYREDRDDYRQYAGSDMSSGLADDYGSYNGGRFADSGYQDYNYSPRNVRYIPDCDEDSGYRSGANYTGGYGFEDDTRYNSGPNRYSSSHWNNDGERNRYY